MTSVEEASQLIQSNLYIPKEGVKSLDESIGYYLAEDVYADRDFPPFNRVAMDGIAINHAAFESGVRSFIIDGIQYAGASQLSLKEEGACLEVMTGAMLPNGTDTVVRIEDIEIHDGVATMNVDSLKKGQNVHTQASDAPKGKQLIKQSTKIGAAEIGVLATVGKAQVNVYLPPRVAIISTGDELVSVDQNPLPHQIRRSNSHVLKASLSSVGVTGEIFHINDEKGEMLKKLTALSSQFEVLIMSGGVSKGKKDFVPEIMETLGVKELFHRVAQKPGKPFWFGKNEICTVFALPGNPVSTYLCFNKYIKPWLTTSLGQANHEVTAVLADDISFDKPLTYFAQVKTDYRYGHLIATPVLGQGSGDLANLLQADGFIQLPAEESNFKKGASYELILYRSV